jgi:hypothetical protein
MTPGRFASELGPSVKRPRRQPWPGSIRIYTSGERPTLVATMRRPDTGTADDVLRAHGWHRVTPWARSDDTPPDHALAVIESNGPTANGGRG